MDWVKKLKPLDVDVGVGGVDGEDTATELGGTSVADDDMEVESEGVADSEGAEVKVEPVGKDGENDVPIEATMVLAASVPTGEVAVVWVPGAAQSVAETVTVDTRVTVTILSVPMTTVGVTIPFVEEEVAVASVTVLDAPIGMELGIDDEVAVGVEADDGVEDKI